MKIKDWSNYDLNPEYLKYSSYKEEKKEKKLFGQLFSITILILFISVFVR